MQQDTGLLEAGRRPTSTPAIEDAGIASAFFTAAVAGLAIALAAGLFASKFYVSRGDAAGFVPLRTIHDSFAAGWIVVAAQGFVLACLPTATGAPLWSRRLAFVQLGLWVAAGAALLATASLGLYTGREYINFPTPISALVFAAGLLMAVNFFKTVRRAPVYVWMWGCGIVLFLWTWAEAHAWLLPFYRHVLIRDMTVQWKSYGAMAGSWNLMVYGLSFFCADRLCGGAPAKSHRLWTWVFWLALANALLGWAHHTYHLPQSAAIRWIAFIVSMSEILLLIKAMRDVTARGGSGPAARLFRAAGFWIAGNLLLSMIISVPRLNGITHGTQVTVAHSMGAMIGINLTLLAAVGATLGGGRAPRGALALFHLALAIFVLGLTWMGLARGTLQLQARWSWLLDFEQTQIPRWTFAGAGVLLVVAILTIVLPVLRGLLAGRPAAAVETFGAPRVGLAGASAMGLILFGGTGMGLWYGGRAATTAPGGGEQLFQQNCLTCHGIDARGTPDKAPTLMDREIPYAEVWIQVSRGEGNMPSFPHLSEADVLAIVEYLGRLRRGAP